MLSILYNIPDSPWPDWGGRWIVLSVYCEIWPRGQEMVWPLQARDPVGISSQYEWCSEDLGISTLYIDGVSKNKLSQIKQL